MPDSPLAAAARLLYDTAVELPRPAAFVHLTDLHRGHRDGTMAVWPLPKDLGHPLLPVVGFCAPERWQATGVVVSGRQHLSGGPVPAGPVHTTMLRARSGECVSVIGAPDAEPSILHEVPEGFAADVVARTLGLSTPPPGVTTAAFVELTWLDRVAAGLLQRRAAGRSWRWLADRHPLRGAGPVPEPHELAARTAAHGFEETWAGLRQRLADTPLPAADCGPEGGTVEPLGTWFDDGSLCRFVLRPLPAAPELLEAVFERLPGHSADAMRSALVTIGVADGVA